ncbi:DUF6884 domain-containing protein [Egicoccus sp. AB-alg2]|uniref:DUF6884 domain-containing protein n=1 Tax=Egicoccus sp. AB-alg2 TaxID=3242693 RepID=UPI00359DAD60
MRVGLVGCVKSKLNRAPSAADLYTSPLFSGRRAAAERHCDRWFVLSALHGLVHPDQVLEPYDHTLNDVSVVERRRWSLGVVEALGTEVGDLSRTTFEVHAGATYTDHGLVEGLEAAGAEVELPVRGLGLIEQLAWYRLPVVGEERRASATRQAGRTGPGRRGRRYAGLRTHLESTGDGSSTLRFADIEELLGAPLPASAHQHRAWWGNNGRSPQAAAWLSAGYEVEAVDQRASWVRFRRVR